MKFTPFFRSGYTLVELLIAITISLFLLLGVTELFRSVGTSITDTQKLLNMAANLNSVGIQLRSDLGGANAVINQPSKMGRQGYAEAGGYFEIVEGMNTPATNKPGRHVLASEVFVDTSVSSNPIDHTVGDVDDILMFTATSTDRSYPFRGLVNGEVRESTMAEIVWFVRGKTLYRRVLLIDDGSLSGVNPSSYTNNDVSIYLDGSNVKPNTLETLKRRENRFAHGAGGGFPYPIYYGGLEAWYYLRLPTLEETVHNSWPVANNLPSVTLPLPSSTASPYWDLWEKPYAWHGGGDWNVNQTTGSIGAYVESPRHKRAGEDIVLTNVLSFDVKVWNPYWVPLEDGSWAPPQYVDLGQDKFYNASDPPKYVNYTHTLANPPVSPVGYGFTLKGRYNANTTNGNRRQVTDSWWDKETLNNGTADGNNNDPPTYDKEFWSGTSMPCVYDTWTVEYENKDTRGLDLSIATNDPAVPLSQWTCPPPYDEPLVAVQVTIRCYDPDSGNIRQLRLVHRIPEN